MGFPTELIQRGVPSWVRKLKISTNPEAMFSSLASYASHHETSAELRTTGPRSRPKLRRGYGLGPRAKMGSVRRGLEKAR